MGLAFLRRQRHLEDKPREADLRHRLARAWLGAGAAGVREWEAGVSGAVSEMCEQSCGV